MAYSVENRRFSVTAPGGKDDLLFLSEMTVHEAVSALYQIDLTLLSERNDIAFTDLIGQPLSVEMMLDSEGKKRFFHGLVARFSQGRVIGRFVSYRALVVPWLWMLTRGSSCRIFQQKSVPEIVQEVFDDLGMPDYKLALTGSYPKREYCVQYRETHFNFVSRLLEEEGIAYYFEHEKKAHRLVLFDDPSSNPAVAISQKATHTSAEDHDRASGEIEEWTVEQEFVSGKYATSDFDFRDPGADLLARVSSSISAGGNERFEIYDYPGEHSALEEGERKVRLRMEAEEAASHAVRGRSERGDFSSGHIFDLVGHDRPDFDQTYLLTNVVHHATQSYGGGSGEGSSYGNSFGCIPHSVPYRPLQRTAKPLVGGAQTATVVGASGSEIDVDEYGRVVVRFHWDRKSSGDETSSCRVRVAQNWAGKNWGAIFNPRIGQEVIVEFLEGDPDRPIVTGRVYNGEQKVPYDLPSHSTQSGIKTRSSKGGGAENFSEIRFEDKKGDELLYVHAEKDETIVVENDKNEEVGNDETVSVGHDRTESIGHDENIQVGNDRSDTVNKNETRSVGENKSSEIGKNESVTAGGNRSVRVGASQDHTVEENQTLSVGKDRSTTIGENNSLEVGKAVLIDAGDSIVIKTGKAQIAMKKDGTIVLEGKDIAFKASGKIHAKASSDVIIKGSKVTSN